LRNTFALNIGISVSSRLLVAAICFALFSGYACKIEQSVRMPRRYFYIGKRSVSLTNKRWIASFVHSAQLSSASRGMKAWNMEQPLDWLVRNINKTHAKSAQGNRRRMPRSFAFSFLFIGQASQPKCPANPVPEVATSCCFLHSLLRRLIDALLTFFESLSFCVNKVLH
jgi:hypothetical protein